MTMKEWCKKYLGLFGFGVLLFGVLITIISNFILGYEIDSNIAMGSFVIMTYKYVGVVFAFIYGYFVFKETYSFLSVFGIFLLLSGVILNAVFKNQ